MWPIVVGATGQMTFFRLFICNIFFTRSSSLFFWCFCKIFFLISFAFSCCFCSLLQTALFDVPAHFFSPNHTLFIFAHLISVIRSYELIDHCLAVFESWSLFGSCEERSNVNEASDLKRAEISRSHDHCNQRPAYKVPGKYGQTIKFGDINSARIVSQTISRSCTQLSALNEWNLHFLNARSASTNFVCSMYPKTIRIAIKRRETEKHTFFFL